MFFLRNSIPAPALIGMKPATEFMLTLRALPNVDGIKAVRAVLKILLRSRGARFTCATTWRRALTVPAAGHRASAVLLCGCRWPRALRLPIFGF